MNAGRSGLSAMRCWNSGEPIKQAASGINGCFIHPGQTALSTNAVGTPLINSSKYTYRLGAGIGTPRGAQSEVQRLTT